MGERLISLRLDDDADAALRVLTDTGVTRSQAIRDALVETAARRQRADLAAEARALAADDDDRGEMAEVAALMESLRAAG